jgi:hypothetical protein
MDPNDLQARNATYGRFVELGRAPTADEVGLAIGADAEWVRASWRRLHDAHALVVDPTGDIRMANPFSAVPTAYRVEAAGRSWFANCAWDAFGIGVVLGGDTVIHTACPDCAEPIDLAVHERRPDDGSLVFHVLVPAAEWWADIGYT